MQPVAEREIDNLCDAPEEGQEEKDKEYLGDREALFDKFFNQSQVE